MFRLPVVVVQVWRSQLILSSPCRMPLSPHVFSRLLLWVANWRRQWNHLVRSPTLIGGMVFPTVAAPVLLTLRPTLPYRMPSTTKGVVFVSGSTRTRISLWCALIPALIVVRISIPIISRWVLRLRLMKPPTILWRPCRAKLRGMAAQTAVSAPNPRCMAS